MGTTWVDEVRMIHDVHRQLVADANGAGWSMAATARRFGVARSVVSISLAVARAFDRYPQLMKCGGKRSAYQALLILRKKRAAKRRAA